MFGSVVVWLVIGSSFAIPGGFLLYLGKRIQRKPLSDQSAHRLFHMLLIPITLFIFTMYMLDFDGGWLQVYFLASSPLFVALIAMTCLHIYHTHSLHNRRTALMVLVYLVVIGLVNVWYIQNTQYYAELVATILALVVAGLTIALIWQTVDGYSRPLWFVLIFVIAPVGIYNFAYNGLLRTWPHWLLWVLDFMATFLIPVLLLTLAGRAAIFLASSSHPINWRRGLVGVIVAGLLIALLSIHLVDMFLLDGFDDWGVIGMPVFFGILAISITLLLIWTLERRRIPVALAYLVIMAAIIVGFFVLLFSINDNPEETSIARAEQVNTAIHAYFADNGHYPGDLYDLIPRYLLTIPNPVLFYDHIWCYEGGEDFYRLAYVFRPISGAPSNTFTIHEHASAGEVPAESRECDTLLIEYRERWNGDIK